MKTYTLYGFTKEGKRVACATTQATSKEDAERKLSTFAMMMCDGVFEVEEGGE